MEECQKNSNYAEYEVRNFRNKTWKFSHENRIHLEDFRVLNFEERFDLEEIVPLVVRLESRGLIYEIYDSLMSTSWEGPPDSFDSRRRNKA